MKLGWGWGNVLLASNTLMHKDEDEVEHPIGPTGIRTYLGQMVQGKGACLALPCLTWPGLIPSTTWFLSPSLQAPPRIDYSIAQNLELYLNSTWKGCAHPLPLPVVWLEQYK